MNFTKIKSCAGTLGIKPCETHFVSSVVTTLMGADKTPTYTYATSLLFVYSPLQPGNYKHISPKRVPCRHALTQHP